MAKFAKFQVEMHKSQAHFLNDARTMINNQSTQIKNLEVQMGQMANMLNERQQGTLPSALEVDPMRKERSIARPSL